MKTVLVHGLGQNASSWRRTVEAMENNADIVCPNLSDLLGDKAVCYSNLYRTFEKYCGHFEGKLNLCGLSLGGTLVLQYGIEHPDKVNDMVLIGTQYIMPKKLLKFQNIIFHMMPNRAFQNMGFRKKEIIGLSKSMMDLNFRKDLKKIDCPVLILCGEKDKANKTASFQMKEQIACAEISIVENAGHEVNLDTPKELGAVLSDFFQKNESRTEISEKNFSFNEG